MTHRPDGARPDPQPSDPTTTPAEPPPVDRPVRVRVSRPDDLLGLVPYLLGFVPEESLVLLLVRDGTVHLTARVDLVPAAAVDSITREFARLAQQTGAPALVLLVYSTDIPAARALLPGLVEGLRPHGLVDALLADGSRWWSATCPAGAGCCPPEGRSYDLGSHPMAAEAVYAGLSAAAGRGDVAARVAGPPASELAALDDVFAAVGLEVLPLEVADRQEVMAAAVQGFLADPHRLDDAECARFALLASEVAPRDVAWALIDRIRVEDHLDLWGQVVARTVAAYAPAPLCLLGMAAWVSGDGALQNCCSDRAQRLDPAYSMAALLEDINRHALPPSVWDRMAADLRGLVGPLVG